MVSPKKVSLGKYPTDIDYHRDISEALAVNVYVKHEELADIIGSGIKLRQMEYLIGCALDQNYKSIILDGSLNSNCAMSLSYYCKLNNIEAQLVIKGIPPECIEGNHKIMIDSGAKITYVGSIEQAEVEKVKNEIKTVSISNGLNALVVPTGASDENTIWGILDLADEINAYEKRTATNFDYILFPVGTGCVYLGMEIGKRRQQKHWKIIGVGVDEYDSTFYANQFKRISEGLKCKYGMSPELFDEKIYGPFKIYKGAAGAGYGLFESSDLNEVEKIRQMYGLYLGPTYMHKCFKGLCQLLERKEIRRSSNVLLINTGGQNERLLNSR